MFEFKPDYEKCKRRIDAFWEREIVDRALVYVSCRKPDAPPAPVANHASLAERWMDVDFRVREAEWKFAATYLGGDTPPIVWPNLGPSVYSAFYGCPLHFEEITSWVEPCLDDWREADRPRLDTESVYYKKCHELTDALIEAGRGRWITGLWDIHPGGDHLAALRGTERLLTDLLTDPDEVKALLARFEADYFKVYDDFYGKIHAAGLPTTTWLPLLADGRYYVPSNDFSYNISKEMFDEFFLDGIRRECQFLDRSIYHLDGPGSLAHLDSILSIPELDALQWVFGAGNEGFHKWVDVYKKALAAGKGVFVTCYVGELDLIMETLRPEGVMLSVHGARTPEDCDEVVRRVERWA